MTGRPITYVGQQIVNGFVALAILGLLGWFIAHLGVVPPWTYPALLVAALLLGILFVLPIGGADMPVVISLLNSATGVAVAITGFELSSTLLIICGALVGDEPLAHERALRRIRCGRRHGAGGCGRSTTERA